MIQSMTGYGKATKEFEGKRIVAEIKSLNSKQLDLSTRVSQQYRAKDIEIRNLIASALQRGKVDFSLYIENTTADSVAQINFEVLSQYLAQIKNISEKAAIKEPEDWFPILLRLPDVLKTESVELSEEEWAVAKDAIKEAINQLGAFREQEGQGLFQFFETKINNIAALLQEVPKYETARIDKIKDRLEENLKALEDKISYDKNRLEQEMIFYVEKLDISEEKQRLSNHLGYFMSTMQEAAGQGKKLGFIAQEMGREINTLGSKANQSDLQIIVVKMKDELEQIKEQVLNVL